jgi:hypothetical protein
VTAEYDNRRWISRDPLDNAETSQGPNLYEYVKDNPLNGVDPFGLGTWSITISNPGGTSIGAAIGGLFEPPVINASYTMDDSEKKCCTSFKIERSASGNLSNNPNDDPDGGPYKRNGNAYQPGRSSPDQPGPAI